MTQGPPRSGSATNNGLRMKVAELEQSLSACSDRIGHLEREAEIHIKRMAAMQAELDSLRAQIRRT
jgi:hypothetical protein